MNYISYMLHIYHSKNYNSPILYHLNVSILFSTYYDASVPLPIHRLSPNIFVITKYSSASIFMQRFFIIFIFLYKGFFIIFIFLLQPIKSISFTTYQKCFVVRCILFDFYPFCIYILERIQFLFLS